MGSQLIYIYISFVSLQFPPRHNLDVAYCMKGCSCQGRGRAHYLFGELCIDVRMDILARMLIGHCAILAGENHRSGSTRSEYQFFII